jgi:hypothetical protein
MTIDPPPDWYIRQIALRALRGESVALPIDPNEPDNVFSIEAARTRRATKIVMRRRFASGPTEPAA